MTISTAHPGTHISVKTATLALTGVLLAGGAGFGVAALVLDDASTPAPTAPAQDPAGAGSDDWRLAPNRGPAADYRQPTGTRYSGLPPGMTDEQRRVKLERLR